MFKKTVWLISLLKLLVEYLLSIIQFKIYLLKTIQGTKQI